MIVVMPNGSIATENLMDEVPLFAKDLMNDIIPYIEANYRVLTDQRPSRLSRPLHGRHGNFGSRLESLQRIRLLMGIELWMV